MSSMLEQAIVDAAALREAALKNAEQSIIEKYAPQIKEAVNSLLDKDIIQEQDEAAAAIAPDATSAVSIEAPLAASPANNPEQPVELSLTDEDQVYEFDLEAIKQEMSAEGGATEEGDFTETEDLAADLGLGGEEGLEDEGAAEEEGIEDDDALIQEIYSALEELDGEEVIEEEMKFDGGPEKTGSFETSEAILNYENELALAKKESDDFKEENEELEKKVKEISESLQAEKERNNKILKIVEKLDKSLNETLLSNAKLLYCNKTLSDASLNERQKQKIVEAIAKAKTPEEAKNLQEALKTTVGTAKEAGPKSLSESVQRRSNLSGMMPRRKKPEQEFTFADKMKKLAGIK